MLLHLHSVCFCRTLEVFSLSRVFLFYRYLQSFYLSPVIFLLAEKDLFASPLFLASDSSHPVLIFFSVTWFRNSPSHASFLSFLHLALTFFVPRLIFFFSKRKEAWCGSPVVLVSPRLVQKFLIRLRWTGRTIPLFTCYL